MKKILNLAILLVVGILLVGCNNAKTENKPQEEKTASAQEVKKLRLAHNQTSLDNPYQFGLQKFAETLKEVSGGKMEAEVFAGTLGTNENELAMKLSTDSVDVVVASPGFMSSTGVKEFDLLSLLYLFDSFEDWESKIDGEFGNKMKDIITEKTNNEFKVIGYYSSGVRNYYGKKPITVPEDVKGLNIRLQQSPVQQEFWKNAGANPINVGWAELYQALNTGTADAAENDMTNMSQQEHHKTKNGKYTSTTEHDYTTRLLLMNGKNYDNFTEEEKEWINKAAEASVLEERTKTYEMLDLSKAKILEDGGEINEVDKEKFKAIAVPIQDKFIEDNNLQELIELIRK
ncbi:MAG: TRAP transporter substrate-binding protein [Peptoniphilus sp.]|uniref:TRAP transporter substrate-binding protein n=1 Tax=Peptoniphilus sp. TaxID=1971214 RepID=UPI002A753025|nr:TRAP transporter substrate-binding protein [Peptoniphilus sp.]MDY2986549.1 TRAP transporter substrate-binding protein [Peptoniphilus sp.]